jgi:hypothetical protein
VLDDRLDEVERHLNLADAAFGLGVGDLEAGVRPSQLSGRATRARGPAQARDVLARRRVNQSGDSSIFQERPGRLRRPETHALAPRGVVIEVAVLDGILKDHREQTDHLADRGRTEGTLRLPRWSRITAPASICARSSFDSLSKRVLTARRARDQTDIYLSREDLGQDGLDPGAIDRLAHPMQQSHAQQASITREPAHPTPERCPDITRQTAGSS